MAKSWSLDSLKRLLNILQRVSQNYRSAVRARHGAVGFGQFAEQPFHLVLFERHVDLDGGVAGDGCGDPCPNLLQIHFLQIQGLFFPGKLIEQFVQQPEVTAAEHNPALDTLTERELEVFAAVARGLSNQELADELFMSHATAKTHVSRLLAKLHARDRAQLVMIAYESGLVTPGAS